MNPGPAISNGSAMSASCGSTASLIRCATSRGFDFSVRASDIATLHW